MTDSSYVFGQDSHFSAYLEDLHFFFLESDGEGETWSGSGNGLASGSVDACGEGDCGCPYLCSVGHGHEVREARKKENEVSSEGAANVIMSARGIGGGIGGE